jgi:phosphatidylserine decarboxylase
VERLLGPAFADVASRYAGGSLMISRLAPQDYHRFHMAVSGRVVRRAAIDGALYTVNPVAVRQHINVYTENKRVVRDAATPRVSATSAPSRSSPPPRTTCTLSSPSEYCFFQG